MYLQTFLELWLVYHSLLWWVWCFKDIFAADLNPSGVLFICFNAHSGRCEVQGKLRHVFWKAVVDWELSAAGTDDVFLGLFQPDYPQLLLIQVRLLLGSWTNTALSIQSISDVFKIHWLITLFSPGCSLYVSDIGAWRQLAGTTAGAAHIKDSVIQKINFCWRGLKPRTVQKFARANSKMPKNMRAQRFKAHWKFATWHRKRGKSVCPSIHSSIRLFSVAKSKWSQGGTGAYPSCHWVKAWYTLEKFPVHHRADIGSQKASPGSELNPGPSCCDGGRNRQSQRRKRNLERRWEVRRARKGRQNTAANTD